MALVVNTNVASITSQMYVNQTNKDMADTMARLSSGKRINTAADDAAGVAIASRLSSEIRGTNQAIRNASDAQALIDTAEGAQLEVANILQRMRELAVQAANDTNSSADRSSLADEMSALTNEIDRIANVTNWAGEVLLDGAVPNATQTSETGSRPFEFHIGAGNSAADEITVNIAAIGSTALGIAGTGGVASVSATENRSSTTYPGVSHNTITTAGTFALSIDASNGRVTVTPPTAPTNVNQEAVTITVDGTAVTVDLFTDGVQLGYNVGTAAGAAAAIANKLSENATLSSKGVNFSHSSANTYFAVTKPGAATIDVTTANQIQVADFTAGERITLTIEGQEVIVNASNTDGFADTQDGLVEQITKAINDAGIQGITATANYTNNRVDLAKSTSLDISNANAAQTTIGTIDRAIATINSNRADLGAVSNRLDSTIANLSNIAINLDDGRSRIEDADFAAESANLAKQQIMLQAGTAMLAQANASQQNVLSLLG
jgi:flagellin